MVNQLTPEEQKELQELGIDPEQVEEVPTEPQDNEQLSPQEVAELEELGLSPEDVQPISAQQSTSLTEEEKAELQALGIDPATVELDTTSQLQNAAGGYGSETSGQPEAEESDLFSAFLKGGQEAVLPYTMSDEQIKEEPSGVKEVAAQMAGAIGLDLAAAAVATKAGAYTGSLINPGIGTAVGAASGLLGYAVYSALGQEEVAEKRTGEYSAGRAATRVALAVNPMVRYGNQVGKALVKLAPKAEKTLKAGEKAVSRSARVTGQVAGEYGVAKSEFDQDTAEIAGIISLALHGFGFRGRAPTADESELSGVLASHPNNNKHAAAMREALVENSNDINNIEFKDRMVGPRLARFVTGKGSKKAIKQLKNKLRLMDQDQKDDLARRFKEAEVLEEAFLESTQDVVDEFGRITSSKYGGPTWNKIKNYMSDGRVTANAIDRDTGLGMVESSDRISMNVNRFETESRKLSALATRAARAQKKAGISNNQITKLFIHLAKEPGWKKHKDDIKTFLDKSGNLAPKVKEAVELWNHTFREAAGVMAREGVDVDRRKFYVPVMSVSGPQRAMAVEELSQKLTPIAKKLRNQNPFKWSKKNLIEKLDYDKASAEALLAEIGQLRKIAKMEGLKPKSFNLKDLATLNQKVQGRSPSQAGRGDITASYERIAGDIPEEFREMSMPQLFRNYLNSNVRQAFLSESIEDFRTKARLLRKAGFKEHANWAEGVVANTLGERKDNLGTKLADQIQRAKFMIHKNLQDETLSPVEMFGWKTTNMAMEAGAISQSLVHAALLSLNIAGMVRDLASGLTNAAPEIGGEYGYKLMLKAALTGGPFKNKKKLTDMGLIQGGIASERIRPDVSELTQAASRFGDKMMAVREATDEVARMWSYNAGEKWAEDIAKGSEEAIRALGRADEGTRVALTRAGLTDLNSFRENTEEAKEILGKMLTGKTQHYYGAEQKAEFLRDIGPLFSMFTKWPFAISSDIVDRAHKKGPLRDRVTEFAGRYGAPWTLMAYLQAYQEDQGQDNLPIAVNYFLKNPQGAAPLDAVKDLGVLNNPAVQTLLGTTEGLKGFFEAENKDTYLEGLAKKGAKTFLGPVSAVLNEADNLSRAAGEETVTNTLFE